MCAENLGLILDSAEFPKPQEEPPNTVLDGPILTIIKKKIKRQVNNVLNVI